MVGTDAKADLLDVSEGLSVDFAILDAVEYLLELI